MKDELHDSVPMQVFAGLAAGVASNETPSASFGISLEKHKAAKSGYEV